jgi:hypothetical protein
MTDQIISLRLSDDDDTPEQINLFFSYGLSFHQFSHLRSLSIHRIYSLNSLKTIINQLSYLPHLIYLKITRYFILYNEIYDIGIIDLIRHLPKLIYCHLDITNDDEYYFSTPSIISSSLKSLSIPDLDCNINQLVYLIKYISNLQSLTICITDFSNKFQTPLTKFLSIKILKLNFNGPFNGLKHLFEIFPNLEELKIEMPSSYIDGYQWEYLIENNLLYLINFQFKMSISLSNQNNKEEKIDELLNSFSNQFWIEKHQWFVQCYFNRTDTSSIISIYSLPYAFQNFLYVDNNQLKSTSSNNWSFDSIQNLYYGYISSENLSLSHIHFNNIRYLYLTIPFNDIFWSIISRFDRLKSLKIVLLNDMNENDQLKLQILFNRLINLHSLTFFSWSIQNIFPFELTNSSIRQLDLRGPNLFYNNQQCKQLSYSSIGQQCEILFIYVKQRTDILNLINNMKNLRVLIVKCSKENENLIEWLEQYLPLTCAISNSNDEIRLWIR